MDNNEREEIAREFRALCDVCMTQHIIDLAGHATTQCHCICGSSIGGPAGNDPCRALQRIKSILERSLPYSGKIQPKDLKSTEQCQEIEEVLRWL